MIVIKLSPPYINRAITIKSMKRIRRYDVGEAYPTCPTRSKHSCIVLTLHHYLKPANTLTQLIMQVTFSLFHFSDVNGLIIR